MQVGDLVRTKQRWNEYAYSQPLCIVLSTEQRIDGLVIDMMDPQGVIRRWLEENLEVISESR